MEIIYRGYDVAETNHLAGNLVAAGLHPVTEQQDRIVRRGSRYFQWVIWLPADELARAKPVLCEWQLAHDAKIKPDRKSVV